jgi:hypothetical protein
MKGRKTVPLDAPAEVHTDGIKKYAHPRNGGRIIAIGRESIVLEKASKEYIDSWRRDAARFEAEKKGK